MLSKRNFAMMITMIIVVLVLFLFPVGLKEYFNDYDVNHAAETEPIEKNMQEQDLTWELGDNPEAVPAGYQVLHFGTTDSEYYRGIQEWADYRKKALRTVSSLDEISQTEIAQTACLLVDGEMLADDPEPEAERLTKYVEQGGVVIFYRLPDYHVIEGCSVLQKLLGVQFLRGESVQLSEIWLFSGFLLGGETHYSFEDAKEPELIDLERNVPWYDISSRTKSYMVGFLTDAEKTALGLENEDMPALIWRSNMGTGSVFAVNGDYMEGQTAPGLLDAMLYEASDYALYSVVNAQNLSIAGFPDLTVENEEQMAEIYGMTTQQFCRDILWPSLVASIQKGNWKVTAFVSVKQSDFSMNEPSKSDLIDYLKFFNEETTEAGASLGRIGSSDLRASVEQEHDTLNAWGLNYVFAGGYIRKENREQLSTLLDSSGQMEYFQDIRTVVGEYDPDQQILSWLTDRITLQNTTANAYRHSDQDSLRLKSLETALGYSNILVDMYQVLWPEASGDSWEHVAEKMAANIDTYWKPFSAFERTTISESDNRVRNFLNGNIESTRSGNEITVRTTGFTGDAYLLLRTHGEEPETMAGGTWKQVEEDTYLLQLTSQEATVILKPETELGITSEEVR